MRKRSVRTLHASGLALVTIPVILYRLFNNDNYLFTAMEAFSFGAIHPPLNDRAFRAALVKLANILFAIHHANFTEQHHHYSP